MAQEARSAVSEFEQTAGFCAGKIRTVVADDSDLVLDAICTFLEFSEQVEIVGRATNGVEMLEVVAAMAPQLVVMDINMPALDGLQTARLLAQHFPQIKILLMSGTDSPKVREQCRESGVLCFANKVNFRQDFMAAFQFLFSDQEIYTA